jgi:hypothetical protein
MNKKIITSFFLLFLLISVVPFYSVSAISPSYSADFEVGTVGQPYTNVWLTTKKMGTTTDFSLSSAIFHTGLKSFKHLTTTTGLNGYFNFTYPISSYLNEFTFWVHYSLIAGNTAIDYKFYNSTGDTVIYLRASRVGAGVPIMEFFDYYGAEVEFSFDIHTYWTKVGFKFNSDDNVTYSTYRPTGSFFVNKSFTPYGIDVNGTRIIGCIVTCPTLPGAETIYYDDFNMTYDNTFPSGGVVSYPHGDLSLYNSNCESYSSTFTDIDYEVGSTTYHGITVENQYDFNVNQVVHAVDLYVNSYQIGSISGNLFDYELIINGVYAGSPSFIFQDTDVVSWIIRWYNLNINISNQKPLFEFMSHMTDFHGRYWSGLGITPGLPSLKTGAYANGDGIFNGVVPTGCGT